MMHDVYDAIVIGAGPNGLAAAITLARAGRSVLVLEARATVGGGCRSSSTLTLPGYTHDICSAIHPFAISSPFFRTLPLEQYGVEWIESPVALAHPLDDGTAVLLERSVEKTAARLGCDAVAYRRLMQPLVDIAPTISDAFLGPLRIGPLLRHPFSLGRFGLQALLPASTLARRYFRSQQARALFAGLAAHSMLALNSPASAAFGFMLALSGHDVGWPFPRGGAQTIMDAMAAYLRSLGGEIATGVEVTSLADLPAARAVLCAVTPRQLIQIAGDHLPAAYRHRLQRFRYGPGAFKLDYALDGPVPWKAPEVMQSATVHLGGTLPEIMHSEQQVASAQAPDQPYVLVAQHSLFDSTRAPANKHTLWAYCHVPNGSEVDMTDRIEAQIERFAPGFQERILARHVMRPAALEQYNANYIGGDINGGLQNITQLFTRPTARLNPYTTPSRRLYICSSSTPPGGGVHGMAGYFAAQAALRRLS